MWWLLVLFSTPLLAQVDVSPIQKLENALPTFDEIKETEDEINLNRQKRKYSPPAPVISLEEIKNSGTQLGSINSGVPIRNLQDNKNYTITKQMFVRYFNYEDEHGFKYIQNKDGTVTWRILSRFVEPIKEEVSLYVPPLKYTPAPTNIVRAEYDRKLTIRPEATFLVGIVKSSFMSDLFNDNKAGSGMSNQYGLHFFTDWKLPIRAGAVFHYEKATFRLSSGQEVIYSSPSFGPQFKTKEFGLWENPVRFQMQFRVSPFARVSAGDQSYKFNSADVLMSLERPYENRLGQFVLGLYFQSQWLNLKDQENAVSVEASNKTNNSFGLTLGQVF